MPGREAAESRAERAAPSRASFAAALEEARGQGAEEGARAAQREREAVARLLGQAQQRMKYGRY